jgi:importin subunit alpha-1
MRAYILSLLPSILTFCSNILPPLINILSNADFKTKKEACWAISNATSGGLQEPSQIRYLVTQGCLKPLCDLLQSMDNKIIQVALDGLENILKVGEIDKEAAGPGGVNQYAQFIEEAGGMVSIHNLQHHENLEIYKKCFYIMDSECDSGLSRCLTTLDTAGESS